MKTTLELPDELYRQAKALAALKGQSMKEWLTLLLRREIEAPLAPRPLIASRRPKPSTASWIIWPNSSATTGRASRTPLRRFVNKGAANNGR